MKFRRQCLAGGGDIYVSSKCVCTYIAYGGLFLLLLDSVCSSIWTARQSHAAIPPSFNITYPKHLSNYIPLLSLSSLPFSAAPCHPPAPLLINAQAISVTSPYLMPGFALFRPPSCLPALLLSCFSAHPLPPCRPCHMMPRQKNCTPSPFQLQPLALQLFPESLIFLLEAHQVILHLHLQKEGGFETELLFFSLLPSLRCGYGRTRYGTTFKHDSAACVWMFSTGC